MKFLCAYRLPGGKKHLAVMNEVSSHEEARTEVRTLIPGVRPVLVLVQPLKEPA